MAVLGVRRESAFAAHRGSDYPPIDVARVTPRTAPGTEGRLISLCLGSSGTVGEQLVMQPWSHADLTDAGLGLRVAHADHAVCEVQIADVELENFAVTQTSTQAKSASRE